MVCGRHLSGHTHSVHLSTSTLPPGYLHSSFLSWCLVSEVSLSVLQDRMRYLCPLLPALCLLFLERVLLQEEVASLPAGSDAVLSSPYVESFSCEGQAYGYFADVENNCEVSWGGGRPVTGNYLLSLTAGLPYLLSSHGRHGQNY